MRAQFITAEEVQQILSVSRSKSVRGQLRTADLEQENDRLRKRLRTYDDVISRNNLWSYFSKQKGKANTRENNR